MSIRNGMFVYSEEASVCIAVLSMPSGSYSGLTIQELVHR
jgi:hypothetical protein